MARSVYIYHVRRIKDNSLLASGTVKHEMHTLFSDNPEHPRDTVKLSRVSDGKICDEEDIPWDAEPSKVQQVAHKLAETFRRNGSYDSRGFYR